MPLTSASCRRNNTWSNWKQSYGQVGGQISESVDRSDMGNPTCLCLLWTWQLEADRVTERSSQLMQTNTICQMGGNR